MSSHFTRSRNWYSARDGTCPLSNNHKHHSDISDGTCSMFKCQNLYHKTLHWDWEKLNCAAHLSLFTPPQQLGSFLAMMQNVNQSFTYLMACFLFKSTHHATEWRWVRLTVSQLNSYLEANQLRGCSQTTCHKYIHRDTCFIDKNDNKFKNKMKMANTIQYNIWSIQ